MEVGEDSRDWRKLKELIEEATVSPAKSLDIGLLQSIKSLVRSSDANVRIAFDTLFDKLQRPHSQVRFLAVLLTDELFTRSKLFRSLLVPKFEMFMLLTIGYRDDYPLPNPPDRATLLRTTSMELVEKWNDTFGVHYKQVRLGYEYLKKALRLQFPNLRAAAALVEQQRQEKEARTQALTLKKYESLCQNFSELRIEIQTTLDEIAECCKILESESVSALEDNEPILDADLESLVFGDDEYEEYGDSTLRRQLHEEVSEEVAVAEKLVTYTHTHTLLYEVKDELDVVVITGKHAVIYVSIRRCDVLAQVADLELDFVSHSALFSLFTWRAFKFCKLMQKETTDNSALFETLRDLYKLVKTNHLRTTQEWLSILTRVDVSDTRPHEALLKEVIDLRRQLLGSLAKCESLGIDRIERASTCRSTVGEVDDDIIWESGDAEADKDMGETVSTSCAANIEKGPNNSFPSNKELHSSSSVTQSEVKKKKAESGLRAELLDEAPVLPYGSFLDSWGAKSDVPANQRGLEMDNHWGRFDSEAMIPGDKIAEMNVRSSVYKPPEREIVSCRAPLKKGGLCSRRDLHRCPLHGPIVPRDDNGNPIQTLDIDASAVKLANKEHVEEFTDVNEENLQPASSSLKGALSSITVADLAKKAIANVREKDEAEARKRRDEKVKAKRTQHKRDREHNDAVLRASALSGTRQQSFGEGLDDVAKVGVGKKRARGGLTALLKKTPTVKERISQRLLSGRVRENTMNELARVEDVRHRDAAANQWS